MKAKVVIKFNDTKANKVRNVGDIFDITADRFNEITKKGRYIEAYEEPTKETEPKK